MSAQKAELCLLQVKLDNFNLSLFKKKVFLDPNFLCSATILAKPNSRS